MVQLIKPNTVKVVTKDGEIQVSIAIELNINLNTDGLSLNNNFANNAANVTSKVEVKKEEKTNWEVPDFESSSKIINFGKK
jgi:hypothetical protein